MEISIGMRFALRIRGKSLKKKISYTFEKSLKKVAEKSSSFKVKYFLQGPEVNLFADNF